MVRVVRHLQTGNTYAMKTLHLNRIKSKASLADLRNEVGIMSELDHPNIVQLYETFETDDHIFLIMELCTGGELLDKLHHQEGHHYSERVAAQLIKKMVGAIRYCHDHHIAHRDLKLENFLFENDSPDAELKLIDFGLSRHYRGNQRMHRPVGTPYYVAPEVLEGSYTNECDMWSIGVIAYMLLSGRPPFYGNDDDETLARVRAGKYSFPPQIFDPISDHGKEFISRLLVVDQTQRMTAREAQEHPWLHCWDESPEPLRVDIVTSLRQFHDFSTVKKIAMEVVAFTLRPDQIKELRREFEKVDVNSNGEITLEELRKALEASGLLSPADLGALVEGVDVVHHHQGTISWHEFLAATMDAALLDEEHIQLAFDRIDTDHKGFISKENFAELVGVDMTAEQVQKVFDEVDVDRDGKLSYTEFACLLKGTVPPSPRSMGLHAAPAFVAGTGADRANARSRRRRLNAQRRAISATDSASSLTSEASTNSSIGSSSGMRYTRLRNLQKSLKHMLEATKHSPARNTHAASHP